MDTSDPKSMEVIIGVPAFNEEANIRRLLDALLEQRTSGILLRAIYVIASGCTDRTAAEAQKTAAHNPLMHVIEEPERKGKAAAVNTFLKTVASKHPGADICVIASADILPEPEALTHLLTPFKDERVGMTGAHPIPVNSPKTFTGFCVKTLWELHHKIALKNPKCGEMIAFRNIVHEIPADTPVDEASIEAAIIEQGFKLAYAPKAIVRNKGPETIKEFINQRRRINYGHIWLKKNQKHAVATGKSSHIIGPVMSHITPNILHDFWLVGLITLELWAKMLAHMDYGNQKKSYTIWERLDSTKNLQ